MACDEDITTNMWFNMRMTAKPLLITLDEFCSPSLIAVGRDSPNPQKFFTRSLINVLNRDPYRERVGVRAHIVSTHALKASFGNTLIDLANAYGIFELVKIVDKKHTRFFSVKYIEEDDSDIGSIVIWHIFSDHFPKDHQIEVNKTFQKIFEDVMVKYIHTIADGGKPARVKLFNHYYYKYLESFSVGLFMNRYFSLFSLVPEHSNATTKVYQSLYEDIISFSYSNCNLPIVYTRSQLNDESPHGLQLPENEVENEYV